MEDVSKPIIHTTPSEAIIPALVEITNPSIFRTYPEPTLPDPGPTSEFIVQPTELAHLEPQGDV